MQNFLGGLEMTALATLATLGFAMLFNVPPRMLRYCLVGATLGYAIRLILLQNGLNMAWSTLLASSVIGNLGIYWASRLHVHPKVFTVAAVIPMIPGVSMFRAMIAVVRIDQRGYSEHLWGVIINDLGNVMVVIAGIVIGLAAPGLLFFRDRPAY